MIDITMDPALVVPAATLAFGAASLFYAGRSISRPTSGHSTKLIGTLLVITLALAANSSVLYALAIFIVATLVTELSFLEKIAALIWNRGKFWDWMIAREPSSDAEARIAESARGEAEAIQEPPLAGAATHDTENESEDESEDDGHAKSNARHEEDIVDVATDLDVSPNPHFAAHASPSTKAKKQTRSWISSNPAAVSAYVSGAVTFEREVQAALRGHLNPFLGAHTKSNLRITSASASSSVEVDAIVETRSEDYVIEIKYAKAPHYLISAARHAMRGADAYRAYLRERNIVKAVVAILVVPADMNAPKLIDGVVPVLKFDVSNGKFVDVNDFLLAITTRF